MRNSSVILCLEWIDPMKSAFELKLDGHNMFSSHSLKYYHCGIVSLTSFKD
jgi:hypothetical protein